MKCNGLRRILIVMTLLFSGVASAQEMATQSKAGQPFMTTAWYRWVNKMPQGEDRIVKELVPTEQQIQFAWSDQPFAIHIPYHMRLKEVDGQTFTPIYGVRRYLTGFGPYEMIDLKEEFRKKWDRRQAVANRTRAERAGQAVEPLRAVEQEETPAKLFFDFHYGSIGMYRLDGASLDRLKDWPVFWGRGMFAVNLDEGTEQRSIKDYEKEGRWPCRWQCYCVLTPAEEGPAAFYFTIDPREEFGAGIGEKTEGVFHYQVVEVVRNNETKKWEDKPVLQGELPIVIRQNGFELKDVKVGKRGCWGRYRGTNQADESTYFIEGEPQATGTLIQFQHTIRERLGSKKFADAKRQFNRRYGIEVCSTDETNIRIPSRIYDHCPAIVMNQQYETDRNEQANTYDSTARLYIHAYAYKYNAKEVQRQLHRIELLYGLGDEQGRQRTGTSENNEGSDDEAPGEPVGQFSVGVERSNERSKTLRDLKEQADKNDAYRSIFKTHNLDAGPIHEDVRQGWSYDEDWDAIGPLRTPLTWNYAEPFDKIKAVLPHEWTASHSAPTHRLFRVLYRCEYDNSGWADQYADVYVVRLSDLLDNRAGGPGNPAGSESPRVTRQIDDGYIDWFSAHCEKVEDADAAIKAAKWSLNRLTKERDKLQDKTDKLFEYMFVGFRYDRADEGEDLIESGFRHVRDHLTFGDTVETRNMQGLSNSVLEKLRADRKKLSQLIADIEKKQKSFIDDAMERIDVVIKHYDEYLPQADEQRKANLVNDRLFWINNKEQSLVELYETAGWYQKAADKIDLTAFQGESSRMVMALMRMRLAKNLAKVHEKKAKRYRLTNQHELANNEIKQLFKQEVDALVAIREASSMDPEVDNLKQLRIGHEAKMLDRVAAKLENEKRVSMQAFAEYMKDRGYPLDRRDTWPNLIWEWGGQWLGSGPLSYASAFTGRAEMLGQTATSVGKEVAQYHVGLMTIKRLHRTGMPLKDMIEITPDALDKALYLETAGHDKLPADKISDLAGDVRAVFEHIPEMKALAEPGQEQEFAMLYGFKLYKPLLTAGNVESFSDIFNVWNVATTIGPFAVTKIGGRWQYSGLWRSVQARANTVTYMSGTRFGYSAEVFNLQDSLIRGQRMTALMKRIEDNPAGGYVIKLFQSDSAVLEAMGASGGSLMRAGGTARYVANQAGRIACFMVIYVGLPEVADEHVFRHLPFGDYMSPAFSMFIHALAELSAFEEGYELLAGMNTKVGKIMPHVLEGEKLVNNIKAAYSKRYTMMRDLEHTLDQLESLAGKRKSGGHTFDMGQAVHPSEVADGGGTLRQDTPVNTGTGTNPNPNRSTNQAGADDIARNEREEIEKLAKELEDRLFALRVALNAPGSGAVIGLDMGTIPAEAMRRAVILAQNGQYKAARKSLVLANKYQRKLDELADSTLASIQIIKRNARRLEKPLRKAPSPAAGRFKKPKEIHPAGDFHPSDYAGNSAPFPQPDDVFSFRPEKYWDGPSGTFTQMGDEAIHAGDLEKAMDHYRKALDEAKVQQWADPREGKATKKFLEHRINQVKGMHENRLLIDAKRQTTQAFDVGKEITDEEFAKVVQKIKDNGSDLSSIVERLGDVDNPQSLNPVFFIKGDDGKPEYVFKLCVSGGNLADEGVKEAFGPSLINEAGIGSSPAIRGAELDIGEVKYKAKKINDNGDEVVGTETLPAGPHYGVITRYVEGDPLQDLSADMAMALRKEWAEHIVVRYFLGDYDGHLGNCLLCADGIFRDIDTGMATTTRRVGSAANDDQKLTVQYVGDLFYSRGKLKGKALYDWIEQMNSMISPPDMMPVVEKLRAYMQRNGGEDFRALLKKQYTKPKTVVRGKKDARGNWIEDGQGNIMDFEDGEIIRRLNGDIMQIPTPHAKIWRNAEDKIEWIEPTQSELDDLIDMYTERLDAVEDFITGGKFADEVVSLWIGEPLYQFDNIERMPAKVVGFDAWRRAA